MMIKVGVKMTKAGVKMTRVAMTKAGVKMIRVDGGNLVALLMAAVEKTGNSAKPTLAKLTSESSANQKLGRETLETMGSLANPKVVRMAS
jgi:hypothetical protein